MSEAAIFVPAGAGPVVHVAGDAYTIKLSGRESGKGLSVFEFDVPPNGGPPPHIHGNEDESFYVLLGEITFFAEGKQIVARAGDFVHAPKKHLHNFKNLSGKPAKMLCWCNPSGLDEYFRKVGKVFESAKAAPTPQPPTMDEIKLLVETAPEFGLVIPPPPGP